MLTYDNLEDARAKLTDTMAYYEGKAVYVRSVNTDPEDASKFRVQLIYYAGGKQTKWIKLDDPKFNYIHFNLGYANITGSSVWWARKPVRQYRQGLRSDQMRPVASSPYYLHTMDFCYESYIIDMLENKYPHFEECEQVLKDQVTPIVAFHKDFAVSWDKLHSDMILEYRGIHIGSGHKIGQFKLADDAKFLTEYLQEAVAV